eukprot:CAMPEP_0173404992 /NCGR_PEP_ID=MMETSP1356-20130122/60754_1 /TAXON_ID=77927 ORGANISM="Hemiselmis virescens, Strain PCC157" /NCGR_SAMPLE_ID=MMETSP1356 /ASSEMBLY_ACC=CAM_ASM_000847 /LENGTH=49 /DNA_ID= /DNA_START= /DNA_END= /DNA_ORIENTATION=
MIQAKDSLARSVSERSIQNERAMARGGTSTAHTGAESTQQDSSSVYGVT